MLVWNFFHEIFVYFRCFLISDIYIYIYMIYLDSQICRKHPMQIYVTYWQKSGSRAQFVISTSVNKTTAKILQKLHHNILKNNILQKLSKIIQINRTKFKYYMLTIYKYKINQS